MGDAELDRFIEAGKLGGRIREESKKLVMVEESLLDIAETIEQMIYDEGVRPAFPVNLSINDTAAHYTPEAGCPTLLGENDILKVDLGVEVDGALSDTAYTVDLGGQHGKLVQATEEAMHSAIAAIRPGRKVGEVGGVIEEKIRSYGFRPISNLTGHMIQSDNLHAGIGLPNIKTADPYGFQVGDVFAVEPFATTGEGYVYDAEQVEIFAIEDVRPVRLRQSRQILQYAVERFGPQPFAERWVRQRFTSRMLVSAGLKELLAMQVLRGYPVLKEKSGGMVAQFEHTILVEKNGARILTK